MLSLNLTKSPHLLLKYYHQKIPKLRFITFHKKLYSTIWPDCGIRKPAFHKGFYQTLLLMIELNYKLSIFIKRPHQSLYVLVSICRQCVISFFKS